jgi:hypothetical protein
MLRVAFGKIRMEEVGDATEGGYKQWEDNDLGIYTHEASSDLVRRVIL